MDIDAKRQADALRRSEEEMRAILNAAVDAIITIDQRGVIIRVNLAATRMFGYEESELLGSNVSILMPPPDCDDHDGYIARYQRTGQSRIIGTVRETVARRKDGTLFPIDLAISEVDHLQLYTGIIRDLSERERFEQALRSSQSLGNSILDSLTAHIAVLDADGNIVAVNRAWSEFAQANGDRTMKRTGIGMNYLEVCRSARGTKSQDAQEVADAIVQLLHGALREYTLEYRCDSETQERWFLMCATALTGPTQGVVVSHLDITRRKQAEDAFLQEHQLNERLIDTAQCIVLLLDDRGNILSFNSFFAALTGYSLEEVRHRSWFDTFIPEHERARIRKLFQRSLQGESTRGHVNSIITREGHEREIEWYDAQLNGPTGDRLGLLCTGQDMTERRLLENEVLEIADDERRRIGHDLHDGVCQELTGLGMLAQAVANMIAAEPAHQPMDPATRDRLCATARQLSEGLGRATVHARKLSHGLVPVDVDAQGLMSALRELVKTVDDMRDVQCVLVHDRPVEVTDNYCATHLYRIAQEAINNALKHSHASHVHVALADDHGQISLTVTDDGVGIPQDPFGGGMGLRIMKYRADLMGAVLSVDRLPGGGTQVTCCLTPERPPRSRGKATRPRRSSRGTEAGSQAQDPAGR